MSAKKKKGTVYLVGAGPGDPGLISVRGLQVLREADSVVYDRLVSAALLCETKQSARLIPARRGKHGYDEDQSRINGLLLKESRAGRRTVRLKGGDPFIYGRGGEEAEYLSSRRIPFEIVPGVTAAIGASASAGIPLTDRTASSCVTFATGHGAGGKEPILPPYLPRNGTLVVYMGIRTLPDVVKALLDRGWSPRTPSAVVASATLPSQKVVPGTLSNISDKARAAKLKPPALVIIGEVARQNYRWFRGGPLRGKRIIVTRPRSKSARLTTELVHLGASVVEIPAIELKPPKSWRQLDLALKNLNCYWGIAFTSASAVDAFFDRLRDARLLHGIKLLAVGPATAEAIHERGVRADLVSPVPTVERFAKEIARRIPAKARLLHPCADLANPLLRKRFLCDDIVVYRIAPVRSSAAGDAIAHADLITFTSSETVRRFAESVNGKVRKLPAACIGPVTARTARESGFRVAATANPHTVPGLIRAIRKVFRT